jgi:hypothetical protein
LMLVSHWRTFNIHPQKSVGRRTKRGGLLG